ncbi:uncharacterized protein LOC123379827 [Felis catus]|uniref:uncharacterized protein LOC123379827 n=1 Tax=Felis catus TaxID=9685 RepID=UPI001D1A0701|nr:uncharacterized protein LOC123379827 [Felis catus]
MSSVQGAGAHVWACGPMEVEIQCRRRSRNSPGVPPLPGLPQPCDVALKEPVPPRPSPVPPVAPTDLAWAGAHRATPPTKRDFSVSALWNTGTEHPTTFSHCTLWSHASEDRPHGHSRKPNVNVEQQRQQVCAAGHKDQQARQCKQWDAERQQHGELKRTTPDTPWRIPAFPKAAPGSSQICKPPTQGSRLPKHRCCQRTCPSGLSIWPWGFVDTKATGSAAPTQHKVDPRVGGGAAGSPSCPAALPQQQHHRSALVRHAW